MRGIGGYIGMEFPAGIEYHNNLLRVNTGRNALEYILSSGRYKTIYLPYYSCDVLLEPIKKLGLTHIFYRIDKELDPIIDFTVNDQECFLYVNYFGIKNDTVLKLSRQYPSLIVDNSQAFFSKPLPGVDTFYSCRKFFGVPDGGYVSLSDPFFVSMHVDTSFDRCAHLLKNIDCGAEAGYHDYQKNEEVLKNQAIKEMSVLTRKVMSSVNYEDCSKRRSANFLHLNKHLAEFNELNLNFDALNAPLAFPFLISRPGLREYLIKNKIFVATYWPNVLEWVSDESFEYRLTKHLLPLPIDHRYEKNDMDHILKTILKFV